MSGGNVYGYAKTLDAMRRGAVLRVSYGLHTSCSLSDVPKVSPAYVSVRFDSFRRLLDEGRIVERPRYRVQPFSLFVYDIAKDQR